MAMLKGSSDRELLIGKMTNTLKPKGKMGDMEFDPAKLKGKSLREGNAWRVFQAITLE